MKFVRNSSALQQVMTKARKALAHTAQVVCDDVITSGTMPYKSGHLQNNATTVDLSGLNQNTAAIVSNTPYARRKYYNQQFNFNTNVNSNAGARWFDTYTTGEKREKIRDVFIREFGG